MSQVNVEIVRASLGAAQQGEVEKGTVFELKGGRICRAQVYSDGAEALEAAGLSE